MRELLEVQGVGANNANDRGVRPMHVACQAGDMALVQRLLELGEYASFGCGCFPPLLMFWLCPLELPGTRQTTSHPLQYPGTGIYECIGVAGLRASMRIAHLGPGDLTLPICFVLRYYSSSDGFRLCR